MGQLAKLTDNRLNAVQVERILTKVGIDLSNLDDDQKRELAEMYADEVQQSFEGVDLQPTRIKINKDSCTFVDPFGNSIKELRGVIVYKQKTRGYWPRGGGNIPECASTDGITGTTQDGSERKCAACPMNEWGTGEDEAGNPTRGKACKEMRRIFLANEDTAIPVVLTLPPTSIRAFDDYISARLSQHIIDIARETVITLSSAKSDNGFKYAVAEFTIGDPVPVPQMLGYKRLRERLREAAAGMDITAEDYDTGDVEQVDIDEEPF